MTIELSDGTLVTAGILLLSMITIESGGAFLLKIAHGGQEATDIRKTFFRAGHAHAGMFVTLALVCQLFVDAADLSGVPEALARSGVAAAAILIPTGFFLSVLGPRRPSRPGCSCSSRWAQVALAAGLGCLGVGLLAAA